MLKKGTLLAATLAIVFSLCACGPSPEKATPTPAPKPAPAPAAEFKVASLDIKPPEVMAGETVSITALVENTGGVEGTYAAMLTVDGITAETKDVVIIPDSSKVVTFSLVKDTPGTYEIGIGGLSSSLTVKEKLIAKELELKYDDGVARDYISVYPPIVTGYLVDFTPPRKPFTIRKVRMCGRLAGTGWEDKSFEVEIWDKDQKVLHSATYPVSKFSHRLPSWVEAEIPDIQVSHKFYVHVYTGTGRMKGIHIGADDSVINEHSWTTVLGADGSTRVLTQWPYSRNYWFGDKSKVNWMIRVVGTAQFLKSADFTTSNLVITPTVAEVGQTVTATVEVSNTGEIEGIYPATLKVAGVQIEDKDVAVPSGVTETASFTFTRDTPGYYEIEVAGLTGLLIVVEPGGTIVELLETNWPELFQELQLLPELKETDIKDNEAIEDIAYLALNPEFRSAFESMLTVGIKGQRKYCTPLQALLWIAYDREFDEYDPLIDYSLEKLIDDAWKNTTTSQNYTSDRWKDFDEVADRLNSPKLVEIYMQDNFTYSYTRGEPEGVKSAEQIFNDKRGACYDHALLAGYCLKKAGYDEVWGLRVRFERIQGGYFRGHIALVFQDAEDSLYYTVDNWGGSAVHGPFESIKEAAEYSVREQGLSRYGLGDINLETGKYKRPCTYW